MAKIDLAKIVEPISEEHPCGPDLDMEFDDGFMNLMAEIGGALPTSYFRFDPSGFAFDGFYDRIGDQLERTHDLRLLVPLAKLRILQNDLAGCAEAIDAMRNLVKTFWTDAHPQALDGDLVLRTSQMLTLDDNPDMILPLQHATIVRSRRAGPITLRKWQVASGDVNPREGEDKLDAAAITSALAEADRADLDKVLSSLQLMSDALADIQKTFIAEGGYDNAVSFDRLPQTVEAMLGLVKSATGAGDAEAAGEGGTAADSADGKGRVIGTVVLPPGAVSSRKEVKLALDTAHQYFLINEPSNPAQLLLRESIGMIGKGFYAAVYDLIPAQAGYSVFRLGRDPYFELSLPDVDSRNPAPEIPSDEPAEESWAATGIGDEEEVSGDPEEEPVGEDEAEASSDETPEEDGGGEVAEEEVAEEAEPEAESEPEPEPEPDPEPEPEPEEEAGEEAAEEPQFWANTRPEAVALIEKVIAYYKVAEPTSPVPLLLERAIYLSSKSFMELLSEVLPRGALTKRESPE